MTSSTLTAFTNQALIDLWDYVDAILPILVPVAIGFAILYGVVRFVKRRAAVK